MTAIKKSILAKKGCCASIPKFKEPHGLFKKLHKNMSILKKPKNVGTWRKKKAKK